ncbi:MAG: preprotein translocase subunit SecG [Bacteroidetes bacterium]|nr:MAG: preprotein translocase subunit SecG [Bacteroidota bacterium]
MHLFILALIALFSFGLIVIVTLQKPSGGLSLTSNSAFFSVKKVNQSIDKFTWALVSLVLVLCLVSPFV